MPRLCFGQIFGILKDSIDNQPIPYVNIWIENEDIGTTSDINGKFSLNISPNSNKTIIFSSVGYKTKKVNSNIDINSVFLQPQIIGLPEIIVSNKKEIKSRTIEKFNKSQIKSYVLSGNKPLMIAEYFPFNEEFVETPFINTIRLPIKSMVDNCKFNIRLLTLSDNGKPGKYYFDENLICLTKKGKSIVTINLADKNIVFPKEGLIIAMEWLFIEENKYEFKYTIKGQNKIINEYLYSPSVGQTKQKSDDNFWIYRQGKWNITTNLPITIELTLTN
jgi:hypothetical protein